MARTPPSTSLRASIDRLIINTPYAEPERHWRYERESRSFDLREDRRPAAVVASGDSQAFDDPHSNEW